MISIRNIEKSFGSAQALRRALIEVHAGEIVALVSGNAAGKSTLVKVGFATTWMRSGTGFWAGS